VVPRADIAAVIAPALEHARERRAERLGVEVTAPVTPAYDRRESPLGNLYTDLMLEAMRGDVAITNGGGLRAPLPAGPLTYGSVYESFPFDNRFATLRLTGEQLARVFAHNLSESGGVLSVSGLQVRARCRAGGLVVDLVREDGKPVRPGDSFAVVTSDFVATGGEASFAALQLPDGAITLHGEAMREGLARVLRARKGALSGTDPRVFDPARPRLRFPGERPVRCPAP
jgi:5'-nucleotidase